MNEKTEKLIKNLALVDFQIWLYRNYKGNELSEISDCIEKYIIKFLKEEVK